MKHGVVMIDTNSFDQIDLDEHFFPVPTDSMLCFHNNRRKDVKKFLSDLQNEEIVSTIHALHVYLRSSPPVHRPLVATLLLNIDLLVTF